MDLNKIVLYSLGSQAQISDTISWLKQADFNSITGNRQSAASTAILHLGDIVFFQDRFPTLEPEYSRLLSAARRMGKVVIYHPGHIRIGEPKTYPKIDAHRTMMAILQAMMDADMVVCPGSDQREILEKYNPCVIEPELLREKINNKSYDQSISIRDRLLGNLGNLLLNLRYILAPPNTMAERVWLLPERAWFVYISEGWSGVRRQVRAKFPGISTHGKTASLGKLVNLPEEAVTDKSIKHTYSIIILTHNNLNYTRLCLESIFNYTKDVEYEIIILDNASTDKTPDYLTEFAQLHPNVKVILSDGNLGFAGGNNRALQESKGDILILLNNDTVVTPNWLQNLTSPLKHQDIGIVGPVTNSSPYENRVQVPYRDLKEMQQFMIDLLNQPDQNLYEVQMLIFFCVALRRQVFEQVGELDEDFRIGLFEDEDYSRRVREAGYKIVYTPNAFVHHWGSVTMSDMGDRSFWRLYHENHRRFENKWKGRLNH